MQGVFNILDLVPVFEFIQYVLYNMATFILASRIFLCNQSILSIYFYLHLKNEVLLSFTKASAPSHHKYFKVNQTKTNTSLRRTGSRSQRCFWARSRTTSSLCPATRQTHTAEQHRKYLVPFTIMVPGRVRYLPLNNN